MVRTVFLSGMLFLLSYSSSVSAEFIQVTDSGYFKRMKTSWSSDGEWIAYCDNQDIYAVSPLSGEVVKWTDVNGIGLAIFGTFKPDSDLLTYSNHVVSNDTSTWVMETMDIESGERTVIAEEATNGCWSHNGRYLAYRTSGTSLALYDSNDGTTRNLGYRHGRFPVPAFSHDDSHIITGMDTDDGIKLFRIPIDGGNPEQITFDDGHHWYPECSRDGNYILYTKFGDGYFSDFHSIFVHDLQTGESRPLFPDLTMPHRDAAFSPDGSKICFNLDYGSHTDVIASDFEPEPGLTLLAAADEKTLPAGESHIFYWISHGIGDIGLVFNSQNGSTVLAESHPASDFSYEWFGVPDTWFKDCYLTVTDADGTVYVGPDDFTFDIKPSTPFAVAPDNLEFGTLQHDGQVTRTVTITNFTPDPLNIDAITCNTEEFTVTPSSGTIVAYDSMSVDVTYTASDIGRDYAIVSVTAGSTTERLTVSGERVEVSVSFHSVASGETLYPGQIKVLSWDAPQSEEVSLAYSTDNGAAWHTIESGVTASETKYHWIVPDTSAAECIVKVSDNNNSSIYATSDSFIIDSNPPAFTLRPVINEVMASNYATIEDEDGESSDWLELFNPTDTALALTGYGLSDRADDPYKWVFPYHVLEPGEHLIVFASDKDIIDVREPYFHTNFKVNAAGETLLLTGPLGSTADSIDTGLLERDVSLARESDGASTWEITSEPTPGTANASDGLLPLDAEITFSQQGGFYHSPVTVSMTADTEDVEIRYTRDGSEPVRTSEIYSQPLTVNSTTVIRAAAFRNGHVPGKATTATYFINETSTVPAISMSTHPDNLFDPEIGIYVQENLYLNWERPIHLELYEADGSPGFSQDLGVQLIGGWARNLDMKSFDIHARGRYGKQTIEYPLFPDLPFAEYRAFVLRNNGNDWWMAYMRDGLSAVLVQDMDIDSMAYRPANLYINGQYWGLYTIREKKDEDYLNQHHPDIDPDNLDIIDPCNYIDVNNQWVMSNGVLKVEAGDAEHYNAMLEFIRAHDLRVPENYEHVKSLIDMPAFIDFYVAAFAQGKSDLPARNMKFWRPRIDNGKWRMLYFDNDSAYHRTPYSAPDFNTFDIVASTIGYDEGRNAPWSTELLRAIIVNEEFQRDFSNRYADCANTIFIPERVITIIRDIENTLAPEVPKNIKRWGNFWHWQYFEGPQSEQEWHEFVDPIYAFAEVRHEYVYQHIMEKFGWSGTAEITLAVNDPEGGSITLNTISPDTCPWSGTYFRDVPVELVARPNPGYRFTGWEGIEATSLSATVVLSNDIQITATFAEGSAPGATSVHINEINYHSADSFDPGDWVELVNTGPETVDLSGWMFRDGDDGHTFTIPFGTTIVSSGYLVLCRDGSAFNACFPEVMTCVGDFEFGLSNGGETVRLYEVNGTLVDSVAYADEAPWPVEPDGGGPTLALKHPGYSNLVPANWWASIDNGTPGASNTFIHSPLDFTAADIPGDQGHHLRLTWSASPSEDNGWVEYYRIYRSRSPILTDPLSLGAIPSIDSLFVYEQHHTILIDSVTVGTNEYIDEGILQNNAAYSYWLQAVGSLGESAKIAASFTTNVGHEPSAFRVESPYPNPLNPTTTISYRLPRRTRISLTVYDILGRKVAVLAEGVKEQGLHTAVWNGRDDTGNSVASGVYLYRFDAAGFAATGKMLVAR